MMLSYEKNGERKNLRRTNDRFSYKSLVRTQILQLHHFHIVCYSLLVRRRCWRAHVCACTRVCVSVCVCMCVCMCVCISMFPTRCLVPRLLVNKIQVVGREVLVQHRHDSTQTFEWLGRIISIYPWFYHLCTCFPCVLWFGCEGL